MKKIFFLLLLVIVLYLAWRYVDRQAFFGVTDNSNISREFEIVKNEGGKMIGEKLESAGLIKNKWFFYYYLWKTDSFDKLQAGVYELMPNMTIGEMVEKISSGKVKITRIKFTVPEGFTNKKIVGLLKEKKPEIADEFERIVNCKCFYSSEPKPKEKVCDCDVFKNKYGFLTKRSNGVDMEGYLFPDTYYLEEEETGITLVSKMLNNFQSKVDAQMLVDIDLKKKNLHEILTLASIIEREAKTDKDKKLVAGVFENRLRDKHPLQSCATLAYFLGIDKPQFSYEDTQIKSPYNTYLNPGLPPGPIANPGLASIKAAIYPEKTDYYFFLSDNRTGEMVYSKTGEEHAENKAKHGL